MVAKLGELKNVEAMYSVEATLRDCGVCNVYTERYGVLIFSQQISKSALVYSEWELHVVTYHADLIDDLEKANAIKK